MRRRELLACAGVSVAGGVAGCLSELGDEETEEFEPRTGLGRAEPVEFRGSADRDFEFIDEDEERIRVLYESGRTDEREFEDWSEGVCRHTGARELAEHLYDSLDTDREFGVGSGTVRKEIFETYDGDTDELREALGDRTHTVYVWHETVFSRDGTKINEPEIGYDKLLDATPREIRVTAVFEDHGIERDCRYPVVVKKSRIQED